MPPKSPKIDLLLRDTITTYRIIFGCNYNEIEQNISINTYTALKIIKYAIDQARCKDFNKVLNHLNNAHYIKKHIQVKNNSKLSIKIRINIIYY